MKKGSNFIVYNIAFSEIFLILTFVFSFAFFVSEIEVVSGKSFSGISGILTGNANYQNHSASETGKEIAKKSVYDGPGSEGILGQGILEPSNAFTGHLIEGLNQALIVVGIIQLFGSLGGLDRNVVNSLSIASTAGIFTANFIAGAAKEGLFGLTGESLIAEYATGIGIAVAVVTFVALYKKESKKVVQFQCLPWEAPLGGQNCETCNNDRLAPCSEYRCKSLGQACGLVNQGTKQEECVWISPNDVNSPTITPSDSALSNEHKYVSHETRPPSLGTRIVRNDNECIRAFTPLEFGIETNEPAQCRIDLTHTESFDGMLYFFGESNFYQTNHTQMLSLPSPNSFGANETFTLLSDGEYDFFVRCRDANGNENTDEFVFSFCVDPSPDTTAPVIVDTSITSGSPVSFGADEVPVDFFVNEPAECRWSVQDKDYDSMENSMSCSTEIYQQNAQQLYTCSTTLTGIKDRENNNYFVRCKDQPNNPENERNVNTQSFVLNILGSQPLNIISSSPNNETITGSTSTVKLDLELETSNGAGEGDATCYFSPTGDEGRFISMFETGGFSHRQTLTLTAGSYDYFFRCVDSGGNSDEAQTSFEVVLDRNPPLVTRAYREGSDALKLVTNEDAECSYSLNSCNFNFDEGLKLIYSNPDVKTSHFVEWNSNSVYYVKCRDEFGNQPAPNQCSIVASASNVI